MHRRPRSGGRRPAHGRVTSGAAAPLQVARIDEAACIGCTLCIQACPVDALIGAPKRLHAVLSALCSGCGLCLPPCPVECICMAPIGENIDNWKWKYPVVEIKAAPLQKAA